MLADGQEKVEVVPAFVESRRFFRYRDNAGIRKTAIVCLGCDRRRPFGNGRDDAIVY